MRSGQLLNTDVDPTVANSKEALARQMRLLRLHADNPAYRELEKQAIQRGLSLPRSTLGDVLAGKRFPNKAFLLTFAQLCGVDTATDDRWEITWKRLAPQYLIEAGSADPDRDQEHSPADNSTTGEVASRRLEQIRDGLAEMAERLANVNEENVALRWRINILTSRVKALCNEGHDGYPEGDITLTCEIPYNHTQGILSDKFHHFSISYSWYCASCKVGGDSPDVAACPWCAKFVKEESRSYTARIPAGTRDRQRIRLKNIGMCSSDGRGPGSVYLMLMEEPPF